VYFIALEIMLITSYSPMISEIPFSLFLFGANGSIHKKIGGGNNRPLQNFYEGGTKKINLP
tara:strand:- start:682 stop:864 length:183 start_codon:yes stop_codon:yes gene_type:complete